VACPYFIPAERHELELWSHRHRLPLGDGFSGYCGAREPKTLCNDDSLRLQCNLGYANCSHLPSERVFDAVRFLIYGQAPVLSVQFACEREHHPALCGELRYDQSSMTWLDSPDAGIEHLAEASVRAWIKRSVTNKTH
jgi:hypothetical protein